MLSKRAAIAACLTLCAVPATAMAHYQVSPHHGDDYMVVYSAHTTTRTCDQEVDGNRVRMRWLRYSGDFEHIGSWAPSQGCVEDNLPSAGQYFKICEENEGCSAYDKH